jgi:hypothetical protein
VLSLFDLKASARHFGLRALELRFALLAALHFSGNRQETVLQGSVASALVALKPTTRRD